jgi:hypothetical protein
MTNAVVIESALPPGKGEISTISTITILSKSQWCSTTRCCCSDGSRWRPPPNGHPATSSWHFSDFQANKSEGQRYLISMLRPEVQERLNDLIDRALFHGRHHDVGVSISGSYSQDLWAPQPGVYHPRARQHGARARDGSCDHRCHLAMWTIFG